MRTNRLRAPWLGLAGAIGVVCLAAAPAALPGSPLAGEPRDASWGFTQFPVPTVNSGPTVIVAGPDGNLWFTEIRGNRIGRITLTGEITEFIIPTPNSRPDGIAVGPDGNLWFAEIAGNRIGRITVEGVITEFLVPSAGSSPIVIAAGPNNDLWFTERTGNKIGRVRRANARQSAERHHEWRRSESGQGLRG